MQANHEASIVRSVATLLLVASLLVPAPSRAQVDAADADTALPELTGRVVDAAGLLDPDRERALAAKLEAHEQASGDQVVVATVPSLGGADIADYGYRLGSAWRIGTAENDNGALLLVAPNERKVRIEVGRGLEGALTDARSGIIIRSEILPAFRDDDYATGIERGVDAILASIDGEYTAPEDDVEGGRDAENPILGFVPLLFIAMVAVPQLLRRTGLRRAANGAFPAGFAGLFGTLATGSLWLGLGAAVLIFLLVFTMGGGGGGGSSRGGGVRRRSGGILADGGALGGGGFGGGGFGGGGGGFGGGGGGFGGGGASGGW